MIHDWPGALLLLTLLFSRGFCGWICPFGSVRMWLGLLGRKIFKESYNPSGPWERRLRYLKCVVLAVIIGVSKLSGHWRTKPEMVSFTDRLGRLDPDQIRGRMSLNDISQGYRIPIEKLYAGSGLPRTVRPDLRMNRIARDDKVAFEPDRMREVVAAALGQAPATLRAAKEEHSKGEEEQVKRFMTLNEVALKTGAPASTDPRQPVRKWIHGMGKSLQDVRDIVTTA